MSGLIAAARCGHAGLTLWGLVAVALMVPTGLAFLIDERTLQGVSVWVKPLKFQASLALHALTVALALTCLPNRQHRLVAAAVWLLIAAGVAEIAYITIQASLGQMSHYNLSTPWTRLAYTIMGIAATFLVLIPAGFGIMILRRGAADPLTLAVGLGLVIGGVLGLVTGFYLGGQPNHWVGGVPSDAGGLPIVGWSRTGGDLRVAHFFGLHMMQALPLLALVTMRLVPAAPHRLIIWLGAAAGTAITAATFFQAIAGRPFV